MFLQSCILALKSIWSNKMRSFLTMLGIIIGVASVIVLVGLVNGQMSDMKKTFESMGTNRLNVNLVNLRTRAVSVDQMYGFYEKNQEYFDRMSPTVQVSSTVKAGSETLENTAVTGVSEDYDSIVGQNLLAGRFIQFADIAARHKVCVLGYYVASEVFPGAEQALGQILHINGESYEVVGCVERQAGGNDRVEEGGTDDFIYIPYTAAVKLARNGNVGSYIFTVRDTGQVEEIRQKFSDFLYPIYRNENLYRITDMSELLDSMDTLITSMSLLLGGIAGISLLVAGVGVMNIMLVSVTERTREIGIRKSLGARRSTILQQFIIEAAVTSSIGGIIGIAAGCAATRTAGSLMGISAYPTPGSILISFGVSVGIGLLFGYMPASRAASMSPIDALRSE